MQQRFERGKQCKSRINPSSPWQLPSPSSSERSFAQISKALGMHWDWECNNSLKEWKCNKGLTKDENNAN